MYLKSFIIILNFLTIGITAFPQTIDISPKNLEKLKKNIIKIETYDSEGTGLVIDCKYNILSVISANHLFPTNNTNLSLGFHGLREKMHPTVEIVERNEELDIILLCVTIETQFAYLFENSFKKITKANKIWTESAIVFGHAGTGDWEQTIIQINKPDFDCETGRVHYQKLWLNKTHGAAQGYSGGPIFIGSNEKGFRLAGILTKIGDSCAVGIKTSDFTKLFKTPISTNLINKRTSSNRDVDNFLKIEQK